jgi:2-desacetyl-2-hydroxyethyl bacteriochlorophyllide A dehydrogenase
MAMRALVKTAPGPGNLELQEVPIPQIGEGDLLLKVSYCGICGSDLHIEDGIHPCDPPVVIGHEFSGIVDKVGRNVTSFQVGDAVAFRRGWSPYPGVGSDGGFAEYTRAPAEGMWRTPEGVTQQEASQFETVCTPMSLVRDNLAVKPGERVVISGPGMIGLLAANVAKIDGASHVIAVGAASDETCRLPAARAMGADETLVHGEAAIERLRDFAPQCWVEASGAPTAVESAVECVSKGGRIAVAGLGHGPWNVDMGRVAYNSITIRGQWGGNQEYIPEAAQLIRDAKLKMSVPLSIMPLTEWCEAFDMLRRQEAVKILLDPSR